MPALYLICKTCNIEFASGISVDEKTLETSVISRNRHICPKGHTNVYDGKDYYFRSNSRYYVKCDLCGEKIYVNFAPVLPLNLNRETIHEKYPYGFTMKCSSGGYEQRYQASDVFTEFAGGAIVGGAAVGALGFLINPTSGAVCVVGGLLLAMNSERERVDSFNRP